jgi:glycosyltransferase involved in cell wall biosynthesis
MYIATICIPSYNRPAQLNRLLKSIDCDPKKKIQILICEDSAPKRKEVRDVVAKFKLKTNYDVKYIENSRNLGYDGNIRELLVHAVGNYVIYMGDDDMFIPQELNFFLDFLEAHQEIGYVLRAYRNIKDDGTEERFVYYPDIKYFAPCKEAYIELYRKSVFISGVTFKRELALEYSTSRFDGTLLYQLYLLAEICLKHPSAAYNRPFTQGIIEPKDFYFGVSEAEKKFRTPGKITIAGEIKFISSFCVIADFIDKKYGLNSKKKILIDMSKYSFPMIATVRDKGIKEFLCYVKALKKIGLGCTVYFYIYVIGLLLLGVANCKHLIRGVKCYLGKTPSL